MNYTPHITIGPLGTLCSYGTSFSKEYEMFVRATKPGMTDAELMTLAETCDCGDDWRRIKDMERNCHVFVYRRKNASVAYFSGFEETQIISGDIDRMFGKGVLTPMSSREALARWFSASDITSPTPTFIKNVLKAVQTEAITYRPGTRHAVCFTKRCRRDCEVTVDLESKAVFWVFPRDGADAFAAFGNRFTRISEVEAVAYEKKFGVAARADRLLDECQEVRF